MRYSNESSEYVICSKCKELYFKPDDDSLQARPVKKVVGRIPTKQKELPKLGRPFKKTRKPRKKTEETSD